MLFLACRAAEADRTPVDESLLESHEHLGVTLHRDGKGELGTRAFGLTPDELGMDKHIVKPTSVIDWSQAVIAAARVREARQ